LPVNAYRYCEAIAAASGFGWYLYPPLSFSLIWDGTEIAWTYEGADGWYPLRGAQYPDFREAFEHMAPEGLGELAPPFLVQGMLPGIVQIWSGYGPNRTRLGAAVPRCGEHPADAGLKTSRASSKPTHGSAPFSPICG